MLQSNQSLLPVEDLAGNNRNFKHLMFGFKHLNIKNFKHPSADFPKMCIPKFSQNIHAMSQAHQIYKIVQWK